jgi:protein tyrosine phosphatase
MIWQEEVRAIVMVTGLMEGKKQKCARYWPEQLYNAEQKAGAVKYGNIEVGWSLS